MIISAKFETDFNAVYQRNNKARSKGKEGMKNLRCFPHHGRAGHVEKGFCGSTVSLLVTHSDDFINNNSIRSWAQFELSDNSNRVCALGDSVSLNHILENERSRNALGRPLFPTVLSRVDDKTVRFTVNSERGWHYGWISNVHTCDVTHRFSVYIFQTINKDEFRCVGILDSTNFQVFCSRRRRTPSSPSSLISVSPPTVIQDDSLKRMKLMIDSETKKRTYDWNVDQQQQLSSGNLGNNELHAANLLLLVRTSSKVS